MGEFISISGIVGSDRTHVEDALRAYAASKGGEFSPPRGGIDEEDSLWLSESSSGVTVMYPGGFFDWDDASAHLSQHLNVPVFSFHIHDGDLWMFIVYVTGEAVAQFNPVPDYWDGGISAADVDSWAGEAASVAGCIPGLQPERIECYFTRWDLESDAREKAYSDDEFTYGDCWQMSDFMRRVGLRFPIDEQGNSCGTTHFFRIDERPA